MIIIIMAHLVDCRSGAEKCVYFIVQLKTLQTKARIHLCITLLSFINISSAESKEKMKPLWLTSDTKLNFSKE